jgi:VanZ family protein
MNRRLLALGITVGIVVLCLLPHQAIPEVGPRQTDKVVHVAMFLVFAMAWRRAGAGVLGTIVAGLVLAGATEGLQGILPIGRTADLLDVAADAAGLAAGLLLARATSSRARRAPWPPADARARDPS